MGSKTMSLVPELYQKQLIFQLHCIAIPVVRLSKKDIKLAHFPDAIYKQGFIKKLAVFQSLVYHIVR